MRITPNSFVLFMSSIMRPAQKSHEQTREARSRKEDGGGRDGVVGGGERSFSARARKNETARRVAPVAERSRARSRGRQAQGQRQRTGDVVAALLEKKRIPEGVPETMFELALDIPGAHDGAVASPHAARRRLRVDATAALLVARAEAIAAPRLNRQRC